MTEPFWRNVLKAKTFNSDAGRILQQEARKKLAALDKKLPLELVEAVYAYYLVDAPYDLWNLAGKTRDEHAASLDRALGRASSVQASFLRAAYAEGEADGLRRAGALMALIARTTNVPGLLKSLAKNWAKVDASLAGPGASALGKHLGAPPELSETLVFYGVLYLVARTQPKHDVLARLDASRVSWEDPYRVVDRTLAAAAAAK